MYYFNLKDKSIAEYKEKVLLGPTLPSHMILYDNIDDTFSRLAENDIQTMFDIQQILKNKKKLQYFSDLSGISPDILIVLKRQVNSYHPKAMLLSEYTCFDDSFLELLKREGYTTTENIYSSVYISESRKDLSNKLGVDIDLITQLAMLCDLCRLRYVGASFGILLANSSYSTIRTIKQADSKSMYLDLLHVNTENKYYKGKFGERDMIYLINDANFIPDIIQL